MFPILVLLFIFVPIIEIMLFIQVGGLIGMWSTIAIVLTTAVVGAHLVRSQGFKTIMTMQDRMQKGELPAQQIVEGVLLAVAGILLLTPGFMTDILGMAILIPQSREWFALQLMKRVQVGAVAGGFDPSQGGFSQGGFSAGSDSGSGNGNVYEGEFEEASSEAKDHEQKRLDDKDVM